jgi:hypothetical protein
MQKFIIGKVLERASVRLIVVHSILTGMLTRRSEEFPAVSLVRYNQKNINNIGTAQPDSSAFA